MLKLLSVLPRSLYFLLLLTLGATQLPACAQSTDTPLVVVIPAAKLPWLQNMVDSSAVLRQHQVGISLADAATGETLFGYNDSRYFTPASTMKLFSFYAGLKMLPDSLPSLRYFSRGDTLFFQGTGDPTFLHGDVPSRRAYAFLANRPEKMLAYCDIASVPIYGPSWSWDDYTYYFQPERTAFPIYGNTVRFYAAAPLRAPQRPGGASVKRAVLLPQRVRVLPRSFAPLTEQAPVNFLSPDIDPDTHVRRDPQTNRFYTLPSTKKWIDEVPFRTSRTLLLRMLGDTLRRPIVGVLWRPKPGDEIRTLRGLRVDSLYRRMLRVSDNFLAEQLLLMCSTTLGHDSLSTSRAIRVMQRKFLNTLPDKPVWVDGSGLSRLNLTTPRTFTALLLKLHQEVEEPRLLSVLAAGGGQGTLRKRYHDANGTWFWGKTGTLTNNVNIAGYVRTKTGRLVAVSFFNNGFPGDDKPVRNEMERLLREVRDRL
ncbi:D-alanyl-D-alanine carboxypeptidase / D-alanyl-D-alanine-endopeptidase (penicillin-binding protein 4) [Hymenobacter arizonensis]|uniref:D-alanyl-D-alanine carboxypeptidase / D-alanyl-D-alanine-endopeptidase (Penicillin-binding protein 4) n=1 Tax=Hymenobacter arizonensis TaxID=1227077 RepID=A0A1I6AUG8_HYMAR|nr:D-alanyl-D-alanine carboxypeptidase / D-alanyl-D-alanine-endopeptidase (penicillin-binding protein 4) [Hymenobacter arizonensis]